MPTSLDKNAVKTGVNGERLENTLEGVNPSKKSLPHMELYQKHLEAGASWLMRSIVNGRGGSCAYYTPLLGWSRPYPETTGYLIPTLIRLDNPVKTGNLLATAVKLGEWLLGIQLSEGAWQGGLYSKKRAGSASVFNTGQVLKGMAALYRATGESRWLDAASRGALWLARGVNDCGCWPHNDYRSELTPSYYVHVAWPMLEVWSLKFSL